LYIYLINYSTQILENMYREIDLSEKDLFNRIENIGLQKLYVQQKHPEIFDFLKHSIQEESLEVKAIIEKKVDHIYENGRQKIFANIDYSKFRDDIDIEKAIEILNWTMSGFGEKGLQQIKSFENISDFGNQYLKEWHDYAQIIKKTYYKKKEVLKKETSTKKRVINIKKEVVKITGLQKNFGDFKALNDVSFTVKKGEVLGFIGPNGAGKSTTKRTLLGVIKRD